MKHPSKSTPATQRREIGVDVSKDTLDVFDGAAHWQVSNDPSGIRRLPGFSDRCRPYRASPVISSP